eukprot:1253965-Karenia_brevis.AAC.1
MAEINGLQEPCIRARDGLWYKHDKKGPNPWTGITDEVLNQSLVPHEDICLNIDPHALANDQFAYNSA